MHTGRCRYFLAGLHTLVLSCKEASVSGGFPPVQLLGQQFLQFNTHTLQRWYTPGCFKGRQRKNFLDWETTQDWGTGFGCGTQGLTPGTTWSEHWVSSQASLWPLVLFSVAFPLWQSDSYCCWTRRITVSCKVVLKSYFWSKQGENLQLSFLSVERRGQGAPLLVSPVVFHSSRNSLPRGSSRTIMPTHASEYRLVCWGGLCNRYTRSFSLSFCVNMQSCWSWCAGSFALFSLSGQEGRNLA